MPIVENVHPSRKLVHTVFLGRVLGRELIEAAEALGKRADFSPSFDQLLDCRLLDVQEASAEELRRVGFADPFAAQSRRCFLAPGDIAFGLARMYQQFFEEMHPLILVTRDVEEAWRFLRLAPDAPERANADGLIESLRGS